MDKYASRPSKPVRAALGLAAFVATISVASFIDALANSYLSASSLAAKAKPVVVAEKR